MITINEYTEWYRKEKQKMLDSGHFASEPTFLFEWDDREEEWIFNPCNWNGGDILRHGLIDALDEGKQLGSVEIKWFRIDDQTTIFIFTSRDWYEISWYKDRGRTDHIKMNGNQIFLEDYIDLCNLLNIPLK